MIDDDDYGAVGGMRIDRGNRSTRRKPAPVPLICTNYERCATVINQHHLLFKTWLNGNGTTPLTMNGRISIVLLNRKANFTLIM
jgi:hypothetical protein